MTISSGLAMSWQEWHKHDAVGLAQLVRARKITPKELCAQAAEAVTRIDPQIEAVLGLYEDVLADPDPILVERFTEAVTLIGILRSRLSRAPAVNNPLTRFGVWPSRLLRGLVGPGEKCLCQRFEARFACDLSFRAPLRPIGQVEILKPRLTVRHIDRL